MKTDEETISVSKARENLSEILGKVKFGHKRVRLTSNGKKVGAIVPLEDLELIEALEDKIDIELAIKALKDDKTHSLDEVLEELGLTREALINHTQETRKNKH
jgi:prevent-host-death family protein